MIQRREFLSLSVALSASRAFAVPVPMTDQQGENTQLGTEASGPNFVNETRFIATFRAFIDTLLPADDYSQSASALQVDTEILGVANKNHEYKRLIYQGCEWLNAAAKYEGNRSGKFATLAEPARVKIIEVAETTGQGRAGPARFVRTTLQHANAIYYSKTQVWQTIGYRGPPQPDGFTDYRKPFATPHTP